MKIFDSFMFSDENMLLNVRLNVLNQFVDKFIISGRLTYMMAVKKLNFNIKDYRDFQNKIDIYSCKRATTRIIENKL